MFIVVSVRCVGVLWLLFCVTIVISGSRANAVASRIVWSAAAAAGVHGPGGGVRVRGAAFQYGADHQRRPHNGGDAQLAGGGLGPRRVPGRRPLSGGTVGISGRGRKELWRGVPDSSWFSCAFYRYTPLIILHPLSREATLLVHNPVAAFLE